MRAVTFVTAVGGLLAHGMVVPRKAEISERGLSVVACTFTPTGPPGSQPVVACSQSGDINLGGGKQGEKGKKELQAPPSAAAPPAAPAPSAAAPPPPQPKAGGKNFNVIVGGVLPLFVPNTLQAAPGDQVTFLFSTGNHTVTQSSKDQACQPLQATNKDAVHSGHIPYADGQQEIGTFTVQIANQEPMFLYCATGPHCQENQIMVINPSSPDDILKYREAAAKVEKAGDGGAPSGGVVGSMSLAQAAEIFTPQKPLPPPPPKAETPPPAAAAPPPSAGAPPAAAGAQPQAAAPASLPSPFTFPPH